MAFHDPLQYMVTVVHASDVMEGYPRIDGPADGSDLPGLGVHEYKEHFVIGNADPMFTLGRFRDQGLVPGDTFTFTVAVRQRSQGPQGQCAFFSRTRSVRNQGGYMACLLHCAKQGHGPVGMLCCFQVLPWVVQGACMCLGWHPMTRVTKTRLCGPRSLLLWWPQP
jgi:hypothetical protein